MIIAFFGHSYISNTSEVKVLLMQTLKNVLPVYERVSFYLGGYGDFDRIAAEICRNLKSDYSNTETVFVSPYFSPSYQKKIKENLEMHLYDTSIYPPLESVHPRYAIVKRNEWIVDNADLIIGFVEHSDGGAYRSITYAEKRGKTIINLAKLST